ncbi:hypothetical protein E0Z10_g5565 [Xylaria hypoxylon]|uniref:Gfo/Idh/MocA-like oxidoreductase N-terminal domain-containing protein n=1 Tax=Xylaria hypoxylon TaxID=37992 RepID=A0A4Z0YUX3_9PEZI|nr:hypothetical protein E0Z10_g5565 [Xylaria hypoxylon]
MAQTEQKIFNVGVIGYGMSAKIFHIPFITTTPAFKLHSILQRSPKPESSAPQDYPNLNHFQSLEPFLSDAALDVVVLSTTPDTHFSLAQQALNAGKHIFVEKPFVPTAAEASELIRLAEEKNLKICVYQNRRWDSDFQTVRKLLSEDTLGRIYEFETHFDRYRMAKPTSWKGDLSISQGGSALYDLGTHLVDQAYVLFGTPSGVFAKLVSQRDGRVLSKADPSVEPDSVNMQLFYASGLIVHVRIGVLSAETRQPRFWIRGTKGSYHKDGLDTQEDQLKAGMKTSDAQFGRDSEEWHGRLVTVNEDEKTREEVCPNVEPVTYRRIYELFGEALRGKGPVPVPASEARDVLLILEAARESAMTGREVELS